MAGSAPSPDQPPDPSHDGTAKFLQFTRGLGANEGLERMDLWPAVEDATPVGITISGGRVSVPGGARYSTDLHIQWTPEAGVEIRAAAPAAAIHVAMEAPNGFLRRRDMWTAAGRMGRAAISSSPDAAPDVRYAGAMTSRPDLGDGALRLRPKILWARERRSLRLSQTAIEGVIAVPSGFMFSSTSNRSHKDAFGSGSSTKLDASEVTLGDGHTRLVLQERGAERMRVRVTSNSRATLRSTWSHLRIALSIAADFNAQWLCWRESVAGRTSVALAGPQSDHAPTLRLPPISTSSGLRAFDRFLTRACDAMAARPDLADAFSLLETGRLARRPLTQGTVLVAAIILENMAKTACTLLGIVPRAASLPREVVEALLPAIEAIPCEDRVKKRIRGMLGSAGSLRGTDWLHALHGADPALISREDIKAWKDSRDRLAHADFGQDTSAALAALQRVIEATHRLVLRIVGY